MLGLVAYVLSLPEYTARRRICYLKLLANGVYARSGAPLCRASCPIHLVRLQALKGTKREARRDETSNEPKERRYWRIPGARQLASRRDRTLLRHS